jgi:predicted outer membrane protein
MKKEMTTFLVGGIIVAGLGLGVLAQSASTATRTFDELFVQAAASGNAFEIETSRLAGDRSSSASVKSFAASMIAMHTKAQQDLNAAASRNAPATSNGGSSAGTSGSSAGTPNPAQSGTGATSPGGPSDPQGNIGTGNGNIGSNTATNQASGGGASFVALLSPGEQLRVTNLSTLKGVQFDRAYITEQVNAHEGAIVIHRLAAQRLKDGNLKAFAVKSLPMIQAHYAQIVAIAKTIK